MWNEGAGCTFRRCRSALTAASRRLGNQEGQALIEYALILGLVALLTIGVLQALGSNVSGLLSRVNTGVSQVLNS